MKFTVTWTPTAEQDLAAIWMAAADRNAVRSAADTIDRLLARDPGSRGAPNFDTVCTLYVSPLGVDFDVQDADRMVYVIAVWEIP